MFPWLAVIKKVVEAGGGAAQTAIATQKRDKEKYDEERSDYLKRRQEMNALGLTGEEQAALESQYGSQFSNISQEGEQRRKALMASQGASGGQAQLQAALQDQALASARQQATSSIQLQDIAQAQAQQQELDRRLADIDVRQEERNKAWADWVGKTTESGLDTETQVRTTQGTPDTAENKAAADQFGISEGDAQQFGSFLSENPEFAEMLMSSF